MRQISLIPHEEHDKLEPTPSNGKDEMNLAEFPFATLRTRGDSRKSITYHGWVVDKQGNRCQQKWIVRGLADLGLPTEFDERVLVALMAITDQWNFANKRVPFSIYQLLRIANLEKSKRSYQSVEESLKRLVGVTIYSEGAFWDNDKKERITTSKAFHLIDEFWLRYKESDREIREKEGVPGYIIWGETIWNSFIGHYIKSLDLAFFYRLRSPVARRLYRFLDKRMQYQDEYEIDIFDLAGRLGMSHYAKPVKVRQKLQPAFDELIARGFLASAEAIKVKVNDKTYTRIRFVKAPKSASQPAEQYNDVQEETAAYADRYTVQVHDLRQRYGITDELVDIWDEALVEIQGATTPSAFHMWLANTHLLALQNGVALIGTPNKLAVDLLQSRMTPVIQRALEGATGEPVQQLAFQVLETK